MALQVRVTIKGGPEVQQRLKRLGSSLYDFKKAMGDIGEQGKSYYGGRAFNSQGGVFGNRWRDLSEPYATQKRKKWGNKPILVASGQMRKSFYYRASKDNVKIVNLVRYFKYHQSTKARTRRQMMGINAPIKRIVRQSIEADIRQKLAK